MKVITYHITLLEPVLVTALEGDPNEGVAFNYLPGSVLRGVIIGKYLRTKNRTDLDAADPETRRFFFDGTTRYLNGYLLNRQGNRTFPTPQSWQQDKEAASKQTKDNPAPIYDFAIDDEPTGVDQPQSVKTPFCTLTDGRVRLVQPDRQISVHTARTRRFGRAMPQNKTRPGDTPGAVYRYEALGAGQTFAAAVVCDHDADVAVLLPLFTGEAVLGGSRSGGYGRVEFCNPQVALPDWRETGETLVPDTDGRLIITLLSDAVLRDECGQFVIDPGFVTAALAERLGVSLSPYKYPGESRAGRWAFIRGKPMGGFNRKWGLPLPQALSVQMGSVFVFDKPDCPDEHLRELEARGIGERRAEGFGRVTVTWHKDAELRVEGCDLPASKTSPPITDPASHALAERMAERMLKKRLEERLVAKANTFSIVNAPSNAQLSRLRGIISDELMKPIPNPQRVHEFLENVTRRDAARRQFERARIGSTPLLEWINYTLHLSAEDRWKELFSLGPGDSCTVGGVRPVVTDSLRAQYLLRFVDSLVARAAKERRKEAK